MTDQEIKLECLKLLFEHKNLESTDLYVKEAKVLADFVLEDKSKRMGFHTN